MWGIIQFIDTGNLYLSIGVTALCLMIIVATAVFMLRETPALGPDIPHKPVLDLAPVTVYKTGSDARPRRPSQVDIHEFISNLTGPWADIMPGEDVIFTVFCDPKIQQNLSSDLDALSHILHKLIGRAAHTTATGRIHLHVTQKPAPQTDVSPDASSAPTPPNTSNLEIIIADTGNGQIAAQALNLDRETFDFDLADIQPQLEAISGRITHKSRLGYGAEFILTLPMTQAYEFGFRHLTLPDMDMDQIDLKSYQKLTAESAIAGLEAEAKIIAAKAANKEVKGNKGIASSSDLSSNLVSLLSRERSVSSADAQTLIAGLSGLNALIVEDDAGNRDAIRALLSPLDPRLVYAANGREAVNALTTHLFDYIIMDIHMPGLSGIETTQLIRARELGEHQIPVIGLTADTTPDTKHAALAGGIDVMLTKPVTALTLFQAIGTARAAHPHYQDYIDTARRQAQA